VFASVHESRFPLEWQDEPWEGVDAAGAWLLELEARLQPDVVHLNGYVHAALPWRAPPLVVAHSDVVSWWWAVHGRPPAGVGHLPAAGGAGLRAAARVVAPTAAVADDLGRAYDVHDVVVIHNCRRADVVPQGRRSSWCWPPAGSGTPRRGSTRCAAWRPGCRGACWVAGEGDVDDERVEVLGPLPFDRLAEVMARAAVYAAPVRYEPFGLGVLEAGLAGLRARARRRAQPARGVGRGGGVRPRRRRARGRPVRPAVLPGAGGGLGRGGARTALEHSPERTARGYLGQYAQLPVVAR
jgi:hypothetical protein